MTTRRTHIVRVHETGAAGDGGRYMDIEVLDAIAFRTDSGKEVIFNCPAASAAPFIVDDTGDGSAKSPASPTRRTHMKRITSKDGTKFFDAEVLDAISFRDQNGEEWIYNAPSEAAVPYNLTEGSGANATRRTHSEKVGDTGASGTPPTDYVTVERTDMMAFRTINGREFIIKMPSADDTSMPRAATHMTPPDYDPTLPTSIPPDNKDPHVYVKFVPGSAGLLTQDVKVSQGPLWWIRKVGSSGSVVFVEVTYNLSNNSPSIPASPTLTLVMPFSATGGGDGLFDVLGDVTLKLPGVTKIPPVVNPVTDAMLESFYQWTPAALVETTQKSAATGGTGLYWVGGFGTGSSGPPNGYILPSPTLENFSLDLFFLAGQSFPFILTTDSANGDNSPADVTVLQAQAAQYIPYINPADHAHTEAEIAALIHVPAFVSADNSYPTAAAAAQTADWINSLATFTGGGQPTGIYKEGSVATVEGPLALGGGGSGRSIRNGTAVFEINYAQLKSAWAARSPNAPVTFTIDATLPGATSQLLSVSAEGYTKLRDFSLDDKNNPTFTPWDPGTPEPKLKGQITTQASGKIIGTITPDPADKTLLLVTFTQA